MIDLRSLRTAALAAAFALGMGAQAPAAPLPRLEADSLAGTHVVLPDSAAGKPLVLAIAYTKEAEGDLKLWAQKLLDRHVVSNATVFVVVVADKTAFFARGRVLKIVRGAVADSKVDVSADLLVTFNGNGWRQLVAPGDKSTVGIVVCNAAGDVVYAKREPFNQQNLDAVVKLVTR